MSFLNDIGPDIIILFFSFFGVVIVHYGVCYFYGSNRYQVSKNIVIFLHTILSAFIIFTDFILDRIFFC
jgi:hypothetical protein